MVAFITEHRSSFGIESICRILPIAPSTYYEHQARQRDPLRLPARAQRDAALLEAVKSVFERSHRRYGARKVWHELRRQGHVVARCTVERLMRQLGVKGVSRGNNRVRTTISGSDSMKPTDLVRRDFTAESPNALWVADITFVKTMVGFVYVAFVIDAFSKRIVGWKVSRSLHANLVLDALEQALHARDAGDGLVHHSDRGGQYLSIRYTERLAKASVAASVGSKGDSYDNALAESIIGLYKTEVIHHEGPWAHAVDVEIATLEWVHWFNHDRLYEVLGYVPPVEYEQAYHQRGQAAA